MAARPATEGDEQQQPQQQARPSEAERGAPSQPAPGQDAPPNTPDEGARQDDTGSRRGGLRRMFRRGDS